jgi:argininosuccinate synthase
VIKINKIVLAYSGGLDTSVAIKWIKEKYNADVVTLTIDVGQGRDVEAIREKAEAIGAVKHYTIDAKREFAEDYVFPAIKANALYMGKYPVSTSLSRPLIASKLVEVARKEGAAGVAHGSTGKGNDQVRFDVTIKALAPELKIVAPVREWNLSRTEEIEYAMKHKIPIPVTIKSPYSTDQNLWGRSIESGILEQPDQEPPEEIFELTAPPDKTPDKPEYLTITFEHGVPTSINEEKKDPVALIENLNKIAGRHGVGRIDHIEDRLVGIKSREIYECPAATVTIEAHKDLEKMVLTRHELLFKAQVDAMWTQLIYNGLWIEPLKEDLDAFIDKTQERVSGNVRLKLYRGNFQIVGRSSPMSLYDLKLATYETETAFDQKWSTGFIEIWSLPTRAANILKTREKKKN